MYSITRPPFIQPLLEGLAPGRKTSLTVRNDDIYTFRFGDPAYAREYIANIPSADKIAGFYMGPDGYCWGRDFLERSPAPGPRPLKWKLPCSRSKPVLPNSKPSSILRDYEPAPATSALH